MGQVILYAERLLIEDFDIFTLDSNIFSAVGSGNIQGARKKYNT